jgi:hypothetical protein
MPDVTIRCTIEGDRAEVHAFGFVGSDHGPLTFTDARRYVPSPGLLARVLATVVWHCWSGPPAAQIEQHLLEEVTESW